MTYQPKSDGAKEIEKLMRHLDTAHLQWNTYATQLGRGYTAAYKTHEKVLKEMEEHKRASSDAQYFLLSLLCVGFAGGLVGGLLAPWVEKAGENIAKQIIRTAMSETTQSVVGIELQTGLDTHKEIQLKSSGGTYSPKATDPLLYHQTIHGEVGMFFSTLRDEVENQMRWQDSPVRDSNFSTGKADSNQVRGWGERFLQIPILRDYPRTADMPNETVVERQAEIGMWIAWANVRAIDYWTKAIKAVSDGVQGNAEYKYLVDFQSLFPVQRRLMKLGVDKQVTFDTRYGSKSWTIMDINKLRSLGHHLGGPFFSKVADVVKSSASARAELSNLVSIKPIYKRA